MLLRFGVIFSRIFLAAAASFLVGAIVTFIRTGLWHPLKLADICAFYRVVVPDFRLPGLAVVYGVAGSIWIFAYLLALGLALALASAKAAPDSTTEYLRGILLLPITITRLTISGFFYVIRGVIKYC